MSMINLTTEAETHDRRLVYHSRHKPQKKRYDHGQQPTGLHHDRRLADAPCPRVVVETFNKERLVIPREIALGKDHAVGNCI